MLNEHPAPQGYELFLLYTFHGVSIALTVIPIPTRLCRLLGRPGWLHGLTQ